MSNELQKGQCVTSDTLLKKRFANSNEYENIRIDQIKIGDEILTLDEKTGKFIPQKVEVLMDMGIQQTYLLITSSGKQIRTTGNYLYLTQPDTQTPFIIGGTYQVDQSPRIEDLTKNSFIAIANNNIQYVSKLTKIDKQEIKKTYKKNNQTKYFGVKTFAYALVHTIINMKIMSAKLIIDLEYIGHESRIIEIIHRYHPTIEIAFTSIGHDSKKSPAHFAAYSVYLGKRKENITIKIDRDALKGVGQGIVTHQDKSLVTGNTRGQLKISYQSTLDLSNKPSWKKVFDLKLGNQIATQDGWEAIVVLKEFAREHTYDIQISHNHNFVGNNLVCSSILNHP